MAKRNEVFPSKYMKASDLAGKPLIVEIESAPLETLGSGGNQTNKTVLYFRGGAKPLPLNMVNWGAVAEIAGDETDEWPGHRIELFPTTTEMKGKTVDCVRVRAPKQKEMPLAKAIGAARPAADDTDDDIPFK